MKLIAKDIQKITVYIQDKCPWSDMAVKFFRSEKAHERYGDYQLEVINIDHDGAAYKKLWETSFKVTPTISVAFKALPDEPINWYGWEPTDWNEPPIDGMPWHGKSTIVKAAENVKKMAPEQKQAIADVLTKMAEHVDKMAEDVAINKDGSETVASHNGVSPHSDRDKAKHLKW